MPEPSWEPKTLEDYFADWESETFGYGYGTGEEHILPALKTFFAAIPYKDDQDAYLSYDYEVLEKACGPTVTWLLINILCRADVINYGSSPRYGFLEDHGIALKRFLDTHTIEELMAMEEVDRYGGSGYVFCTSEYCNCSGDECANPFWEKRPSHWPPRYRTQHDKSDNKSKVSRYAPSRREDRLAAALKAICDSGDYPDPRAREMQLLAVEALEPGNGNTPPHILEWLQKYMANRVWP